MLGWIAPIACVADLHKRGKRLDHAIEVVGFVNEEGTRFGAPMTGSRAIAGTFDPKMLETKDRNGISMGEAYRASGLDQAKIGSCDRNPDRTPHSWNCISSTVRCWRMKARAEAHTSELQSLLRMS